MEPGSTFRQANHPTQLPWASGLYTAGTRWCSLDTNLTPADASLAFPLQKGPGTGWGPLMAPESSSANRWELPEGAACISSPHSPHSANACLAPGEGVSEFASPGPEGVHNRSLLPSQDL